MSLFDHPICDDAIRIDPFTSIPLRFLIELRDEQVIDSLEQVEAERRLAAHLYEHLSDTDMVWHALQGLAHNVAEAAYEMFGAISTVNPLVREGSAYLDIAIHFDINDVANELWAWIDERQAKAST